MVADEKAGWLRRKGDGDVMPASVDTPAKVSPALDCPTRGEETVDMDAALPESVLFAQALVASFHSLGGMEVVGTVPENDESWAGNIWPGLAPGRQPYQTTAPFESALYSSANLEVWWASGLQSIVGGGATNEEGGARC
jgi:hypothetical protein